MRFGRGSCEIANIFFLFLQIFGFFGINSVLVPNEDCLRNWCRWPCESWVLYRSSNYMDVHSFIWIESVFLIFNLSWLYHFINSQKMVQHNFFSVNGGRTTSDIGLYLPFPAGIYLLQTSEKFMKLVQNQQQRHRNDTNSPIILMFLSLTLNKEMLTGVYMQ